MEAVLELAYVFLTIYMIVIFAWVILSWIPMGFDSPLVPVKRFLGTLVDPYLNLFRGLLPPVRMGAMALDLSAIIGIVLVGVVRGIVGEQL